MARQRRSPSRLATSLVLVAAASVVQAAQPTYPGQPGQFVMVGDTGVSAQQLYLGTSNRIYVIDKTENNPVTINGHPGWASEVNVDTNEVRIMDVLSNTFCAGGATLGNGTLFSVGGNQAITYGGATAASQTGGGPYDDWDGGKAIRLLDACEDGSCNWVDNPANYMTTRRWYPSCEVLEDGSVIIMSGDDWGGYVDAYNQSNPTYEFFPSRGDPIGLQILNDTVPVNLYPLIWLLPSCQMFIQVGWQAEIFDYHNNVEHPIDDIPHAVRVYPASAGSVMLPLTPDNQWTATLLFCGGTNLQNDQWVTNWNIAAYPADATCVRITPDVSTNWIDEGETLPAGRSMGNIILLTDGKLLITNGANTGTAGYGNDSWAIGHSYADNPIYEPILYDPSQPVGQRMSSSGLGKLNNERMYHSTALLLPDSSVYIAGSNPNPDYVSPSSGAKYPTRTSAERWFPLWYNRTRPDPQGLPTSLSYGGSYFNITLQPSDLLGSADNLPTAKVILIRTGYSTHTMNMNQRYVQLNSTYTASADGSATLHVSQLPPNPCLLVPGPAMLFVVVDEVASVGQWVMIGNGQIGTQPTSQVQALPPTVSAVVVPQGNSTNTTTPDNGNKKGKSGATLSFPFPFTSVLAGLFALGVGLVLF